MSMKRLSRWELYRSEKGMVAIMTTMVMIIVISLMVLGFAQLSRRNQRDSLDRQLSTQAFYAAESGINDARKVINDALLAGTPVPDKTTCTGAGPGSFYNAVVTGASIDSSTNTRYSCLLVDATPELLRYNDVGNHSIVVPIISAAGTNISRIEMEWEGKTANPHTGCPTTTNAVFAPSASWSCGYGVLRFDLVPTTGNLNAGSLQANTMTVFAVPFSSGGVSTVAYSANAANSNAKIGITCTASRCALAVTGLSQNTYHMRVSSLYRNVALRITAEDSSNNPLSLRDAQAIIDSTGRSQDVLRRIQVSVPLRRNTQNQMPDFAIQSTDAICKRFVVMDGYFDTMATGVTSSNRLCQP